MCNQQLIMPIICWMFFLPDEFIRDFIQFVQSRKKVYHRLPCAIWSHANAVSFFGSRKRFSRKVMDVVLISYVCLGVLLEYTFNHRHVWIEYVSLALSWTNTSTEGINWISVAIDVRSRSNKRVNNASIRFKCFSCCSGWCKMGFIRFAKEPLLLVVRCR